MICVCVRVFTCRCEVFLSVLSLVFQNRPGCLWHPLMAFRDLFPPHRTHGAGVAHWLKACWWGNTLLCGLCFWSPFWKRDADRETNRCQKTHANTYWHAFWFIPSLRFIWIHCVSSIWLALSLLIANQHFCWCCCFYFFKLVQLSKDSTLARVTCLWSNLQVKLHRQLL